jgi:hypothetical protein
MPSILSRCFHQFAASKSFSHKLIDVIEKHELIPGGKDTNESQLMQLHN